MKHCGTQELETGRLLLRRLSIDDSEMMYNNWASDKQVTRYLRWNAHRSWGETAEILNEWEKHYEEPTFSSGASRTSTPGCSSAASVSFLTRHRRRAGT